MTVQTLIHPFVTQAHELKLFNSIKSFKSLIKMINLKASELFPLSDNEEDNENIINERNCLKGDIFELFGEYLLKQFDTDERVSIYDYKPNDSKDMGVDGLGTGSDGNPAVIQYKFRSNPNLPLTYRDLATFGNDSLANHGIISRAEAQRKNELFEQLIGGGSLSELQAREKGWPFTHSMHNMLIVASTFEVYYTWCDVNRGSRFLGYNQITKLTKGKPQFWRDLKESIKISALTPKKRIQRILKEHQIESAIEIDNFISSDFTRAQIIVPTGGGKTTIEHEAICQSIQHLIIDKAIQKSIKCNDKIGGVYIVVAPRIALVQQILREFWSIKKSNIDWEPICICSGRHETKEYYEGEEYGDLKPTTAMPEIINAIKKSKEGKNIIFFVTNHSVLKIGKALKKVKREANLIIGDEAHNLTAKNFQQALNVLEVPTKKWLFFTATRKVDYSGKGKGMNNVERFGHVIYQISPAKLIQSGMIVPPRLHVVNYDPNDTFAEISMHDPENIRNQMAMLVEGIRRHKIEVSKYGNPSTRVIVFCESAGGAHDFAESEILQTQLPEFYMAAVTSKHERMTDERKNIFKKFSDAKYSILFHYDVVSEGIDLPGATGILPMRPLGEIKATQGIGRTLRVVKRDRQRLDDNEIIPGDPKGWDKPYGWVILPVQIGRNQDDMERIESIVYSLRCNDYDIDIEEMTVIEDPKNRKIPDPDFDDYPTGEEYPDISDLFSLQDVEEICEEVTHKVERENKARVINSPVIRPENIDLDTFDEFVKKTKS